MRAIFCLIFILFLGCDKKSPDFNQAKVEKVEVSRFAEVAKLVLGEKIAELKKLKAQGMNFGELQKKEDEKIGMNLNTLATHAIETGNLELTKFMMNELKVDIKKLHNCVLEYAYTAIEERDTKKMIDYLIEIGADVNCNRDMSGLGGALASAIDAESVEYVKYIVDKGANIDQSYGAYGSPLIYALKEEKPEISEYLALHSKDISFKDDDGKTALDIAKAMNYTNVVKILEAK